MRYFPVFFLLMLEFSAGHILFAQEQGWTESGELAYSYAYARTWLGHQMRKDRWVCKIGFTAGAKGEQEHSVWTKGNRKMQVMIWKIDSCRTGYAKGEISGQEKKKK